MIFNTRKQTLKTILAIVTIVANLNNFVDAKVIPVNDESVQVASDNTKQNETINNLSNKQNNIYLPFFTIIAVSFCVSFGSVICFKSKKNKKGNVEQYFKLIYKFNLLYRNIIYYIVFFFSLLFIK